MKNLKYSPNATEKLKLIHYEVSMLYGENIADKTMRNIFKPLHRLQVFEKSGIAAKKILGIPCDYYYIFAEHNYFFYRITDDYIYIVDIFHEKEDYMWKLFGIQTISQEGEE